MLSLHRLSERSQRGGSAIGASWAPGHRGDGLAVRKIDLDRNRAQDRCVSVGRTAFYRTVSWIIIPIGNIITILVRRRREVGDDDEHGATIACAGRWYAAIRCTPRPSHGDGTSFECWRPRRRAATGCGDGTANASRAFRTRRTSSQPRWTDDGKHSSRYRRPGTGRPWSWRAKCTCALTSQPWSGATDVCTATATAATTTTDVTST